MKFINLLNTLIQKGYKTEKHNGNIIAFGEADNTAPTVKFFDKQLAIIDQDKTVSAADFYNNENDALNHLKRHKLFR